MAGDIRAGELSTSHYYCIFICFSLSVSLGECGVVRIGVEKKQFIPRTDSTSEHHKWKSAGGRWLQKTELRGGSRANKRPFSADLARRTTIRSTEYGVQEDILCELGLFSFLLRIKFDVAKQGPDCVLLGC